MTKPLYAVLGLTDEATAEEIKRAYRSKAKECHPDKPENRDDPEKAKMWSAIKTAYDTLSDPDAKKVYDTTGEMKLDQADVVNAKALRSVVNHFMKAINEESVDVDHFDLIEQAKVYAQEDMAKVEANIHEVTTRMERYRKVQARLKLKASATENPLETALRNTIEEGEALLKEQELNTKIVKRQLEILDRYDYDHIVEEFTNMPTPGGNIRVVVRHFGVGGTNGNSTSR